LPQEIAVLEGAEGFELGHGPAAALLIHGFTGSPQSLRGLGEYLAERGVKVLCPRLPGHGTTWQDLNTCTDQMWVQTIEESFAKLQTEFDEIFLISLSLGASLALDFAARRGAEVAGIVTLAGFVETKDPRRFLAPVLKRLVASLPGVSNDIADPEQKEIAYDRLPTRAADCMLRFLNRARARLSEVRNPILILHSRNDHTVLPFNAEVIHDNVSSEDKELVWYDRSYHVITVDYDRDDVFRRTFEFIKGHSKHAL
jgi:carboxylesterase